MKIEKLPSGSYRMRKMYQGKMYTIVTDYKPTQKEAIQMMAEELDRVKNRNASMTFSEACEEYIESKRNILSPSTIRGYKTVIKALSDDFMSKDIEEIEAVDIQKEINRMTGAPKTIHNRHGFIASVLGMFRPDMKINTTLPQKRRTEAYIPSDEDTKKLLEYASGGRYEIAIKLACYGMRRSEVCAMSWEDVDGDVIHINKSLVLSDDGIWILREINKTEESTRDLVIPSELAEQIVREKWKFNGNPNSITKFIERAKDDLQIPGLTLHKLRHYFASKMSAINVPEADILKMGGWKTDNVMKTVYRHAMKDENLEKQRQAANKLKDAIF